MKYYLLLLTFFSIVSCSKNTDTKDDVSVEPYIKYDAGNRQFEFKGVFPHLYITRLPGSVATNTVTRYALTGQQSSSTGITFEIETDSLTASSFSCYNMSQHGYPPKIAFDGKAYTTFQSDGSQKLSVAITRYSNGTVDGTFQGTLYSFDASPIPIEITQGEFKNVTVLYVQ